MLDPHEHSHRALFYTPCDVYGSLTIDNPSGTMRLAPALNRRGSLHNPVHHFIGEFADDASFTIGGGASPIGPITCTAPSDWIAEDLANLLTLHFGKRVDFLGFVQSGLSYQVPSPPPRIPDVPFPFLSNRPRVDAPPHMGDHAFNLYAAEPILWALRGRRTAELEPILVAIEFYARALRIVHSDIEAAYIWLVTAGEIISKSVTATEEHLDEEAKKFLLDLRSAGLPKTTIRFAESRLLATQKRFVAALRMPLDDEFFSRTESTNAPQMITEQGIKDALEATYSVRSKIAHSGFSYTSWMSPLDSGEMPRGRQALCNGELITTPGSPLTFLGLERVTRVALLKRLSQLRRTV